MQVAAPGTEELRRLLGLRLERPLVLSLYLDLDPSEFATPPARATAARSLLDEADRRLREHDDLSHQEKVDLRASLERARTFLERELAPDGARAVAVFAAESADLFETVKLPRSVRNRVAIGRAPLVGPLAALERREAWCVILVNRREGRIFRGGPDGLRELGSVHDDVHGQHDQGGWSQARYQRSVEKEAADHLRRAADVLFRHFQRRPFEHLLLGGPAEVVSDFESKLHHYLAERVAGRVDVDVENSSPETVLEAARPCFEELEKRREEDALGRVEAATRAAAGLDDVLVALNERRVEALLGHDRFSAGGASCPTCGWLTADERGTCPIDGERLEPLEDVTEAAIELALQQSAEVVPVRHMVDELEAHGGIAALLRF
ncbi:MAG: Vms1/Ankzf1 family peptidyl-tRNA hydrolase [Thermoleophilaceae bacterium]